MSSKSNPINNLLTVIKTKDGSMRTEAVIYRLLQIATLFAAGLIIYTNISHFTYNMNADIAADMLLGGVIWKSGEWIPQSWYTARELRIICTPNLAALFNGITGNLQLSMGLACCGMTLGIIISGYFLMQQLDMSRIQRMLFLLLCLSIPNHFVILELLYLFASYYAIHVIILFFTLGIYVRMLKGRKTAFPISLLPVGCAFALSLQGVRGLLIINVPLLGVEVIRLIYRKYSGNWKSGNNWKILLWCASMVIAGYAGSLSPLSVGQNTSRNIRNGLSKLWETVLPDAFRSIGWENAGVPARIILIILLLTAMAELVFLLYKMLKRYETTPDEWIFLFFWISPMASVLAAAFTTTESTERYYFALIFLLAFGAARIVGSGCSGITIRKTIRMTVGVLACLLGMINMISIYQPIVTKNRTQTSDWQQVADYLQTEGYERAYATFENANTITVLTNGEVQVAAVADISQMDICKWMTSTEWYVPNVPYQEKTAYVVTEQEMAAFDDFLSSHGEDVCFEKQIGKFLVYSSEYNYSHL